MMTFKQFLLQNTKDARKAPLGTTTSKKELLDRLIALVATRGPSPRSARLFKAAAAMLQ